MRGDGMCGEKLAGLGIRSSVPMLSGVSVLATGLVVYASESLEFVLLGDGPNVDKCSSGLWPEGIPVKGLAKEPRVPRGHEGWNGWECWQMQAPAMN